VNNTTPITQQEMYDLIEPFYKVAGGIAAVAVFLLAFFLIVYPFLNRRVK
jgi:hypothetical protein